MPSNVIPYFLTSSFPCSPCVGLGVTRNLRSRETKAQYIQKKDSPSTTHQVPALAHRSLGKAGGMTTKKVRESIKAVQNIGFKLYNERINVFENLLPLPCYISRYDKF